MCLFPLLIRHFLSNATPTAFFSDGSECTRGFEFIGLFCPHYHEKSRHICGGKSSVMRYHGQTLACYVCYRSKPFRGVQQLALWSRLSPSLQPGFLWHSFSPRAGYTLSVRYALSLLSGRKKEKCIVSRVQSGFVQIWIRDSKLHRILFKYVNLAAAKAPVIWEQSFIHKLWTNISLSHWTH